MVNIGNAAAVLDMEDARAAARALGFEVTTREIRRGDDIPAAFDGLKEQADALYVVSESVG